MAGVAGGVDSLEGGGPQLDLVPIRQGHDPLCGKRIDPTPHPLHRVPVDPRRARPELRRVDQVTHACLVHSDARLGELLREGAGGAGVVEMYVGHDDPIEARDSGVSQAAQDMLDSRLRTRLDQGGLLVGYEESPRDAGYAVHSSIDDLNGRAHRVLSLAASVATGHLGPPRG